MQKCFWIIALVVFPLSFALSIFFWPWFYLLSGLLAVYVLVGIYDIKFSSRALNRLYPVVANIRYGFEFIRPELRQYLMA